MADPWAQFSAVDDVAAEPVAQDQSQWTQFAPAPGQATLSAYEPSIRDRFAQFLMPDNPRASPLAELQSNVVETLTGSRGMGRSTALGGALDLLPPTGILFAGNEANRSAEEGDAVGAVLSSLGVVGLPVAPAANAARAALTAGVAEARAVAPMLEQAAARTLPPPIPVAAAPAAIVDDVARSAPAPRAFGGMIRQTVDDVPLPSVVEAPPAVARPPVVEAPPAVVDEPLPFALPAAIADAPLPATLASEAPKPTLIAPDLADTTAMRIVTPDQSMEISARPELVELASLKEAGGKFQPRDRARAEYVVEARERASRLDPAQLGVSRVSDSGAPIVLSDGTVISGNGRTMSIGEVYRNPAMKQQADAYRASLGAEAEAMNQPVLVMRAQGLNDTDAARFADLSNRGRIASMSATERAKRDATALGDVVSLYQGGEFDSLANAPFVKSFMDKVATRTERTAISKDGQLTQEGAARLRNAVLASAYDDVPTLSRILESTDDNIRNITGALTDAAPRFSSLKADIKAGNVMAEMDATPSITDAVKLIADLRSRRVRPADFFAQKDAFGGTDPIVESWVRAFYNDDLARPISREKMTAVLNAYADEAAKHSPIGLFPDETTAKDVLNAAQRAKYVEEAPAGGQIGFFDSAPSDGAGLPQGGATVSGREVAGSGPRPGESVARLGDEKRKLGRGLTELVAENSQDAGAVNRVGGGGRKPRTNDPEVKALIKSGDVTGADIKGAATMDDLLAIADRSRAARAADRGDRETVRSAIRRAQ